MSQVKKSGVKGTFYVVQPACLGCECFSPGTYQTRGGTPSGSRNTGHETQTCMRNAYHGCPDEADKGYSDALKAQRKKEGWRAA